MLAFVGIGLVAGVLVGFLGAGGGVLLVCMLLAAGLSMPESVAIMLAVQAVPLTLPAAVMYYRQGHLHLPRTAVVVAGGAVGVLLGSWLLLHMGLSQLTTRRMLTCLMAAATGYMVWANFIAA